MRASVSRNNKESPWLYARHRRLLALLDAPGDNAGNRDFQKLLFREVWLSHLSYA